jgi:hypothetical protein
MATGLLFPGAMGYCETKERLRDKAQDLLGSLSDIARAQREALKNDAQHTVAALDQEFERLFGEKERTLGALYEHEKEHGC